MDYQVAIDMIRQDLGASELAKASERLTAHVYSSWQDIHHLTYSSISNIAGSADPKIIMAVTQYLSGEAVSILQIKFELILGNDTFELEDEDVYAAHEQGFLVHPEWGTQIVDYAGHVFPFFIPGAAVVANE